MNDRDTKFDDIRPYYEEEIPAAMERIAQHGSFPLLASYVYPHEDIEKTREQIRSYKTIRDFQLEVMRCVNEQVIARSMTGFTYHGIERLSPERKYLFISNHRDIMLDACLLQYVLYKNSHETSQITFGANLMQGQLLTDIGKSNKMFKVERPGNNPRDFYRASFHLSEYIRHVITRQGESVWIAQRNGRTKDGLDRTGDVLKTLELYASRNEKYFKKPGEDLNSILTGIMMPKGRVHIEIGEMITREELSRFARYTASDYNRHIASLIDQRICSAYKLSPNNYIAHDLRYGNNDYAGHYTEEQKDAFLQHMLTLQPYSETCDMDTLCDIFLGIYSNPVDSKVKYGG